ncbi:alcohol dehydrogenase, partial [Lactiplantibacillus plantarum]
MQAVLENGPKKIEIKTFPDPVIKDDEVLMKVRAIGLCQNDVRDYTGDTKWT